MTESPYASTAREIHEAFLKAPAQQDHVADDKAALAAVVATVVEAALRDTAHCHWRVAGGAKDGTQLVRASDLTAWARTVSGLLESV